MGMLKDKNGNYFENPAEIATTASVTPGSSTTFFVAEWDGESFTEVDMEETDYSTIIMDENEEVKASSESSSTVTMPSTVTGLKAVIGTIKSGRLKEKMCQNELTLSGS